MAEINNGFAVIGIESKINCGATVVGINVSDDMAKIWVNSSGKLICFSERKIKSVTQNGKTIDFSYNDNDLRFEATAKQEIVVEFM